MITAQDVGNKFWNLSGVERVEFEEDLIIVRLKSQEAVSELDGFRGLYERFLTEEFNHEEHQVRSSTPTIVFSFSKR